MNRELETDIKEFGRFVEKVVRPVKVPTNRKKRMREELLSHMHEVCDGIEESKSETPSQTAIDQTILRMGDYSELTNELKTEETLFSRCYLFLEELRYDPSKSVGSFLMKHVSMGVGLGAFTSALILALHLIKPNPFGVSASIYIGFLTSLTHLLFAVPFLLLLDPVTRFVHNLEGQPTRLRTICYLLASCLILPGIAIVINYRFPDILTIENILPGILMAPVYPLVILVASKPAAEEIVYHEKWANLEIE